MIDYVLGCIMTLTPRSFRQGQAYCLKKMIYSCLCPVLNLKFSGSYNILWYICTCSAVLGGGIMMYIFSFTKKKSILHMHIFHYWNEKKEILKCIINWLLFLFWGVSIYFHSQKISILIWLLWWLQRIKKLKCEIYFMWGDEDSLLYPYTTLMHVNSI